MYFPTIVDRLSRDLTGGLNADLAQRLYPKSTGDILHMEEYGFILLVLGFILFGFVLQYSFVFYLVFGGLALYFLYMVIDLLKKNDI